MKGRIEEERAGKETWIDIVRNDSRDERKIIVISKEGYSYNVIVEADGSSYVEKREEEGEIPELEEANITFTPTPSNWTNGKVVVTITTTVTGYKLQYSKTGTEGDWTNYTSGIEYEINGLIYARLTDDIKVTNVITGNITNIDKLQPNTFEINPTSTTNSITVPVPTITDNTKTTENGSSGIAKIEYKLDSGAYSESTRTWNTLTQGSNHTVYVKATDNAGNTREISKAITVGTVPNLDEDLEAGNITFTYTPSGWTNGNVVVTMSTTITGYTLQYSKTGTAGDWTNYTSRNRIYSKRKHLCKTMGWNKCK
jgi:hypothetical protein